MVRNKEEREWESSLAQLFRAYSIFRRLVDLTDPTGFVFTGNIQYGRLQRFHRVVQRVLQVLGVRRPFAESGPSGVRSGDVPSLLCEASFRGHLQGVVPVSCCVFLGFSRAMSVQCRSKGT
ncbi:uncharacterized protein LOC128093843 [Culex pipiens pallens]|uniref:uncharacterized protein LOC128093843 n=1 Tax=Culex pipiens pallens TaxID=42434 RepID=UPI0022AAD912|nr:uncharacterized protein LOC128093843 [Culex pipiens pallens]